MKRTLFLSLAVLVAANAFLATPAIAYDFEETLLMKATLQANIKEMKNQIKAGANVNAVAYRDQPHGGNPVLRYAIDSGSLEAVQILLEAKANPNDFTESPLLYRDEFHKANMRNLSLLSHAINSGSPIAIIKELINNGAHLDGSPKIAGDWSPLMIAAFRANKEAVIVLLQAGADASVVNNMDNKTALDYAKEMKHNEIIKILEF
jgi:ankyrin repeat protein